MAGEKVVTEREQKTALQYVLKEEFHLKIKLFALLTKQTTWDPLRYFCLLWNLKAEMI